MDNVNDESSPQKKKKKKLVKRQTLEEWALSNDNINIQYVAEASKKISNPKELRDIVHN